MAIFILKTSLYSNYWCFKLKKKFNSKNIDLDLRNREMLPNTIPIYFPKSNYKSSHNNICYLHRSLSLQKVESNYGDEAITKEEQQFINHKYWILLNYLN